MTEPLRGHALDGLGGLLALLIGLPSLLYPFGSDQAVFHYIGSGWLAGAWPYVDAIAHKPPGIYYVYALTAGLFGDAEWPIRVLDLAGVLAMGWILPDLVRPANRCVAGERGAALCLTAASYYTLFDYWDSAQVELWMSLCLLLSWRVASKKEATNSRLAMAGFLFGLALAFKTPAALVGVVIAVLSTSGRAGVRGVLSGLLVYGAAAFAGLALALLPHALHGSLPSLWEAVILFNLAHADAVGGPKAIGVFWLELAAPWVVMISAAVTIAVVRLGPANRRGDAWAGTALAYGSEVAALLVAALFCVLLQRKFWVYHHVVLLPFAMAALLWALRICVRPRTVDAGSPAIGAARLFAAALATSALGLGLAPNWLAFAGGQPSDFRRHAALAWTLATAQISRDDYLRGVGRSAPEREIRQLGERIARDAAPGDDLCVLGYEPLAYTVSGLRCPSRFFVTLVLNGEAGEFRGGSWLRQYARDIRAAPPRFFIAREIEPLSALEVDYEVLDAEAEWKVYRRVGP